MVWATFYLILKSQNWGLACGSGLLLHCFSGCHLLRSWPSQCPGYLPVSHLPLYSSYVTQWVVTAKPREVCRLHCEKTWNLFFALSCSWSVSPPPQLWWLCTRTVRNWWLFREVELGTLLYHIVLKKSKGLINNQIAVGYGEVNWNLSKNKIKVT